MNFKKILLQIFLFLTFIIPINSFAYSSNVIVGGENVGIKVNTKYVEVVGFYLVDGKYIANEAGLKVGDYITKVDGVSVTSIDEMTNIINKSLDDESISITFIRNNKESTINLKLVLDNNGIYKTGLYVKDTITGIGTLTYIDPTTNIFGCLGHEIIDKNKEAKAEIRNGIIFPSNVVSIVKSKRGSPGEKNARFDTSTKNGTIIKNEKEGIFGIYNSSVNNSDLMEIAKLEEVKLGKAYIRTVVEGVEKKDFEIKILEVDYNSDTKNILFEIIDSELLEKTNGVVAGMSGSPIIQNNKLIGAVTHVVVNSPHKGYAIGIEHMLEEGDKIKEQ